MARRCSHRVTVVFLFGEPFFTVLLSEPAAAERSHLISLDGTMLGVGLFVFGPRLAYMGDLRGLQELWLNDHRNLSRIIIFINRRR